MVMWKRINLWILAAATAVGWCVPVHAQSAFLTYDDPIPAEVDQMYRKGLKHLAASQTAEGCWNDGQGKEAGVVGLHV